MKKITGGLIAVLMSSLLLMVPVWAEPAEDFSNTFGDWTGDNDDGAAAELLAQQEEAAQQPVGQVQESEAPAVHLVPVDEPVSTTGTIYGWDGVFDPNTASSEQVNLTEGEWDINDAQMLCWDGTVIENSGSSSLVVRNSYIRGESSLPTAPLAGDPGMLIAGNVRTTLAMGNSENIYLNSTVVSRNWSSLSTDSALPALAEGVNPLSLYTYGSEAVTMDGGYGAYSDLFSNVYSYGSHVQSAEIGLISGSYGSVTVGTIEDGEKDPAIAAVLSQADRDLQPEKKLRSVIEGGRNALMIYSANLPAYWEYEGLSQEEFPRLSARITASGSMFRTNQSLDKNIGYEPAKQAYINHVKGSVILVKSTNAEIELNRCEIIPDTAGTGYLIQTVCSNDTQFGNLVPDGVSYPGISLTMRDMRATGDIAHEDYQRDLNVTLTAAALDGGVNEYDCAHWNEAAAQEGFTEYAPDVSYETHHGIQMALQEGAVWNVTKESHLSKLMIGAGCRVNGTLLVDGVQQPAIPGTVYEGTIVVMPGNPEETAADPEKTAAAPEETAAQAEPEKQTEPKAEPEPEIQTEPEVETEHVHNWQRDGGSPGTCTEDGYLGWTCFECGDYYLEPIPDSALGHDWVLADQYPADCVDYGFKVWECTRCGEREIEIEEDSPSLGHDWVVYDTIPATCTEPAAELLICDRCGAEEREYYGEALGHDYSYCYPLPGEESVYHVVECSRCGESFIEPHASSGEGYCPMCGYDGPYGSIHRSIALR